VNWPAGDFAEIYVHNNGQGVAAGELIIDNSYPPILLYGKSLSNTTIWLTGNSGTLLKVGDTDKPGTVVLENITLRGMAQNNASLVNVFNGQLILEEGACITSNTYMGEGYMGGGGVVVNSSATLTMRAGEIKNNYVKGDNKSIAGGGVYVKEGGSFEKTGGVISYNELTGTTSTKLGHQLYSKTAITLVDENGETTESIWDDDILATLNSPAH
jgi:hypothetical protein